MARISEWATKFNVRVKPATVQAGQKVYRLKDLFTTRDGSWEPSSVPGSVTQWARDTYLKPFGSEDYFDDAGADHHLLGGVYDEATGKMIKTGGIHYWTWTDNGNHTVQQVKGKSGWANIVIGNHFRPDLGDVGAWAWRPENTAVPADTVEGGGMPYKWHVSFFATWTLETESGIVDPPPDELGPRVTALETWARAISRQYPGGPQYD